MKLAVDHAPVLLLLACCIPPLLGQGARWLSHAGAGDAPADGASRLVDAALRLLAAAPIALLVLALAGLHQPRRIIERIGHGAHIIIALDRSLSMDQPFALRGEKATESKTTAASRMIAAYVGRRPHDEFGLVAFSSAPILSMPLTEHREAIDAAISAMRHKALGNTDIGAGIAMACAQFSQDTPGATHALLLVSDGAGEIPERVRLYLQNELTRLDIHLYYLYLRAGDDPPLRLAGDDNMEHPAGLDAYFRSLGIAYEAFEARDASAIETATQRISALETHPLGYRETVPRRNLDLACEIAAVLAILLGMLVQLAERDVPEHDPGRLGS